MVVIEPVATASEEEKKTPINVKPQSSSSSSTTPASPVALDSSTTNNNKSKTTSSSSGYDSDGFETASETEVNDGDDDEAAAAASHNKCNSSDNTINGDQQQQQQQQLQHSTTTTTDHSSSEAEDELKQKALTQANDAKLEGNKLFGDGRYEEALLRYDVALQLTPPEMPSSAELQSICHSNRATCFFKLVKYEDAIKECTKALELNPAYMKALLRRAEAHEKLEHYEETIADMKKILELDPSHYQAKKTIIRLEPLAAEKREKMKEEMIGKLKEMGNSILGRFGMSTDNFKTVKDPNTGSYSIQFQR
ncbi:hypothetical protein LguiA_011063 [Lonicera macranthoides]